MTWLLPSTWIEGSSIPSLSTFHQTAKAHFLHLCQCYCKHDTVWCTMRPLLLGRHVWCEQHVLHARRSRQCRLLWFPLVPVLQPSNSLATIQRPQSGHLYVQAANNHNKLVFSRHLWPLPLDLLLNSVHKLVNCYYWHLTQPFLLPPLSVWLLSACGHSHRAGGVGHMGKWLFFQHTGYLHNMYPRKYWPRSDSQSSLHRQMQDARIFTTLPSQQYSSLVVLSGTTFSEMPPC